MQKDLIGGIAKLLALQAGNDAMQTGDADETRRWLLDFCGEFGLSATELAHRAQVSPSTLTRFLKADPAGSMLSGRTLQKLTVAQQAIRASGIEYSAPLMPPSLLREQRSTFFHRPSRSPVPLYGLELAPSDIRGPEGSERLELVWIGSSFVGYPANVTANEASGRLFAVYMPGEFMRPRFRTGECLLIDRLRPASTNSEVLVEFVVPPGEARLGTIAQLVDRDRNQIKLHQLQNDATAVVHRTNVLNIYPVIGLFKSDIPDAGLQLDFSEVR